MQKKHDLYFVGVAGTGMASAATLFKQAGYSVCGSDAQIYPPMSEILASADIPIHSPYSNDNIENNPAEKYVIGNCLSQSHPEIQAIIESGKPYTSFPQALGEEFLKSKQSIVVAGTHGKTTTSSLIAHILVSLGEDPSFLIGGVPTNLQQSSRLTSSDLFVLEGDEYDTAFFDKESKFLHYSPNFLILNNLEFDHADIFDDLDAVIHMFQKLTNLVPECGSIIALSEDKNLRALKSQQSFYWVSGYGQDPKAKVCVTQSSPKGNGKWSGTINTQRWGNLKIETQLIGHYNMANIAMTIGLLDCLQTAKKIKPIEKQQLINSINAFTGVKKRLDFVGNLRGAPLFQDFAHHPSAVGLVLESFRLSFPEKRIIVCFEPKNATSRRNIFQEQYAEKLALADIVLIGKTPEDKRIPEHERMDTQSLAKEIGSKGQSFSSNDDLSSWIKDHIQSEDAVIFMSPGDFSGIPQELASS